MRKYFYTKSTLILRYWSPYNSTLLWILNEFHGLITSYLTTIHWLTRCLHQKRTIDFIQRNTQYKSIMLICHYKHDRLILSQRIGFFSWLILMTLWVFYTRYKLRQSPDISYFHYIGDLILKTHYQWLYMYQICKSRFKLFKYF